MKIYSDELINYLIICEKQITEPPSKEMGVEGNHHRNDMKLESLDGQFKFTVFMRSNKDFNENFSIGLRFIPDDDPSSIVLLRFNGKHGEHTDDLISPHPHYNYHIHQTTQASIDSGYSPEKYATVTDKYASYEQAMTFFIKKVRITNHAQYFPPYQFTLFDN